MSALAFCLLLGGGRDLEELAARHRFAWTCNAATGRHEIRAQGVSMVFAPGLDKALLNGVEIALAAPVAVEGGQVRLPEELAKHLLTLPPRGPVIDPPEGGGKPPPGPSLAKRAPCTIVIDPGHGGVWTGYVGRKGIMEKDINLEVSLELRKILESWGAKVVMTRTTDREFSTDRDDDLGERVQIVNKTRPDLFLSIHANGVANPVPRGFEVWVPVNDRDARGQASRDLARALRGELATVWSSDDRGTKDDHNLYVLKNTRCPAALVELEFVSNPAAERELAKSSVRRRLAEAVAEGVRKWLSDRK